MWLGLLGYDDVRCRARPEGLRAHGCEKKLASGGGVRRSLCIGEDLDAAFGIMAFLDREAGISG